MKTASQSNADKSERRGDAWGRVSYKISAEMANRARDVARSTGLNSETEVVEKALDIGLVYIERFYSKAKAELDAAKAAISGNGNEPPPHA